MNIESRLAQLGLTLPEAPSPLAAYVPAVRTGDLIFVSGQVPLIQGKLQFKGRCGDELMIEDAKEAARTAVLNALAVVKSQVPLDEVVRIVKVTGFVASTPDFFDHPQVVNGASELLVEIFGDAGRHSRAAVGVSALPLGAPVEIEMIVQAAPKAD